MIYLDYNATCPVAPEVQESIILALKDCWGNPSSGYEYGRKAKNVITKSREMLAQLLQCSAEDLIFTSGGTESNNLIIHTALARFRKVNADQTNAKAHFIISNIEHDSVRLPLEELLKENLIELSFISVDRRSGAVVVDEVFESIRPNTCLISIMMANNETGVMQPIEIIGRRLKVLNESRNFKIPFHIDAAQVIGKSKFNINDLCVDYLTLVGHKFYGPRIGALFVKGLSLETLQPMFYGGGQERSFRPGTENTPMIAGLGKAAELIVENLDKYQSSMKKSRDYFQTQLKTLLGDQVVVHFENSERLPNTCSVAFPSFRGTSPEFLKKCRTFCASTGAACHSLGTEGSKVLLACGIDSKLAKKTVRFSVGRETTEQDIDVVVNELISVLNEQ